MSALSDLFENIKKQVQALPEYLSQKAQPVVDKAKQLNDQGNFVGINTGKQGNLAMTAIGKILQKVPDTTINIPQELKPKYNLVGLNTGSPIDLTKQISSIPGEMARGYGQTLEKLGKGKKFAFGDYMNVTDFLPGIGFVGAGVKAVEKKEGEKMLATVTDKVAQQMGKTLGSAEVKKIAEDRLGFLVNYHNKLRHLGYSEEEAGKVGWQEAKQIIDGTLKPQDMAGVLTKQDTADFVDSMTRSNINDVKKQVNIIDYFRTPSNVLEKIGLGKEGKMLRAGWDNYKIELRGELQRIGDWQKEVPSPDSNQKIFNYLDGKLAPKALAPKELQVADQIKGYLSSWADKLGLPLDKRQPNYITHLFDIGQIEKGFPADIARNIEGKVAGSVYDPFLQARKNAPEYKQDTWGALDAYMKRATRKVNMDPALASLKTSAQDLDTASYNYVQKLSSRINLRPTELDTLIDNAIKSSPIGYKATDRPTAYLTSKFRNTIYRGALGLNVGSAVRNLTQGVNTYAKLGEKYTVIGYTKLLKEMVTNNLDELYKSGILEDSIVGDRQVNAVKKGLQKMDSGLFAMFDLAEKINRGSAYFGAKAKALSQGKSPEQALTYAKDIVRKTQFSFSNVDTPVALGSDIVKTFAQFQSYNIKQAEFLGGMVKEKDFAGLIRYIGASLATAGTVGKIFGMKPTDMIPFWGRFSPLSSSPAAQIATGTGELLTGNAQQKAEGKRQLQNTSMLLVPGGAQLKKTLGGASVVNRGYVKTPSGKVKYPVGQSGESYLRALLFGYNTLPESRKYYEQKGAGK